MTLEQQLITWRRELHQYPELSGKEFQTTRKLRDWLQQLDIKTIDYGTETGLVAEIGTGENIIAIRADIDALPITETSGVAFSSQHQGVMHACGHDLHTAAILGAAQLLKANESQLAGRVRVLFQPAEEDFSGARAFIRAGVLDGVSAIFGFHNEPNLPVGTFATRPTQFYASVDRLQIRLTGKGAHAARPHEGIDSIVLASQLISHLQTIISREIETLESAVLSITRINGGNTWNVLPEAVELEGTLRTHNPEIRNKIKTRIEAIAQGLATAFNAEIEISWLAGLNTLINDPYWADFATQVAKQQHYQTETADLHLGGEDFSAYLEAIPGAFVSLGSASQFGLHHPAFNPDEAMLKPAARYFAALAQSALKPFSLKQSSLKQSLLKQQTLEPALSERCLA